MPKRKKYPRLPSGYGQISYLGKGRRNPYCVRPPVTEYTEDGLPIRPKPICYTDSWIHGFAALTAWKAGTYEPGMECNFAESSHDADEFVRRILSDYSRISKRMDGMTFAEVYQEAVEWKFSHKELSKSTRLAYQHGFKNAEKLHDTVFASLRHQDLQRVIDECKLSSTSKQQIVTTFSLAYKYAIAHEIVSVDYSKGLLVRATEVKHGQALTEDELKSLWDASSNDDNAKRLLIMCYSGFRISAYKTLEIDLENRTFKGGVKTKESKERIVPIHSGIVGLVEDLIDRYGNLEISKDSRVLKDRLMRVNPDATFHWTRHTFSALCERYGVRENDRKRMLGHKIGDITNDVYGHRTVEELRFEIEKIKIG